jgi:serine/threonine protein kinase
MLLDLVQGRNLEGWLQGLDSPPTQEELDLLSVPLLSALELVHANRTWHLDISPDNVMIRASDGAPILLDFGASKFELKQHSQLVSALVFKSGYSAPEQYTSNAERYGPWTDIYGFAATLYRAISGSRLPDATERQLDDEDKPASIVGKGRYRKDFLEAIDWGLKIRPRTRPQSIAEWRKPLLEGEGALVAPAMTRIATGHAVSKAAPNQPVGLGRLDRSAKAGVSMWFLLLSNIAALSAGGVGTYVLQEQFRKPEAARAESDKQMADRALREREKKQPIMMYNTSLSGEAINWRSNVRSVEECRSTCLSTNECKAFEFRLNSSVCYLYRSVSKEQIISTDTISGRWE